mmetsp:Transcript_29605/g.75394  ORF Transcript_29605/g.75394 Transcript_29605/m.75394 type:complete len:339 (+) Transcript_29605:84-1100(+)
MTLISHGYANPAQGLNMLGSNDDPFPIKRDTMSLDSIRPKDVPRGIVRYPKDSPALRTSDIDGAAPSYYYKKYHADGPPEKELIAGTTARELYPAVRRPIDLGLTTSDIEKAQPLAYRFNSSRNVNPLTPRYDLPSHTDKPPTPPAPRIHEGKARETMEFKGEHKPRILERNYARDPLEVRDIEGAQPNHKNRIAAKIFTPRDPQRIIESAGERILSTKRTSQQTPRTSHPMDPAYEVSVMTTHPFLHSEPPSARAPREAGRIEGSTPRRLHKDNGEPQASLVRSDVPGAVPQRFKGATPFSIYDPPEVTPYARHNGLDCSDIEGAQTGTRRGAFIGF